MGAANGISAHATKAGLWAGTLWLVLGMVASSDAATTSDTFTVQMTIAASCTISSAPTLDFGSQGLLATDTAQASTLQVRCTNTTPYDVGLDAGTGPGATVGARKMISGAEAVTYSLYADLAHTTVWGETVGVDTVSGTGNGTDQSISIYGLVPSQTTPAPGTYTDTITVTITY